MATLPDSRTIKHIILAFILFARFGAAIWHRWQRQSVFLTRTGSDKGKQLPLPLSLALPLAK